MLVLAVDDSPVVLEMIGAMLSGKGHDVLPALNGLEALRVLETKDIDVVLSDINMAGMDGYQLAAHIRKDSRLEGLPVLLMTTSITPEFKVKCREAGGTGWICKPFKADELVSLIKRFDT